MSGNKGQIESFFLWKPEQTHPWYHPQLPSHSQALGDDILHWEVTVHSHPSSSDHILPPLPQHSHLLQALCKSQTGSHSTFPDFLYSHFEPWYHSSGLTIPNVIGNKPGWCLWWPRPGWKAESHSFPISELKLKNMNFFIIFLSQFSPSYLWNLTEDSQPKPVRSNY